MENPDGGAENESQLSPPPKQLHNHDRSKSQINKENSKLMYQGSA